MNSAASIAQQPLRTAAGMLGRRRLGGLIAVLVLSMPILVHWLIPDGLDGAALALVFGHDTQFGSGYTYLGFEYAHRGMSEAEVLTILGEPFERVNVDSGDELSVWVYSRSPTSGSYRVRTILFGRDHRVMGKHAEFYLD